MCFDLWNRDKLVLRSVFYWGQEGVKALDLWSVLRYCSLTWEYVLIVVSYCCAVIVCVRGPSCVMFSICVRIHTSTSPVESFSDWRFITFVDIGCVHRCSCARCLTTCLRMMSWSLVHRPACSSTSATFYRYLLFIPRVCFLTQPKY